MPTGISISTHVSVAHRGILWLLFFLICMGLGYPTISRYDPRTTHGLEDTTAYAAMVVGAPLQDFQADLGHRVLVPMLARPVYWLTREHLQTWSPVFFALLTANSVLMASAAWLLVAIAHQLTGDYAVSLLSAFLYLANFAVANFNLSGYVDSSLNFVFIAIAWSLLAENWWTLPLWGVVGGLSKETFVPLAVVLTLAWWFSTSSKGQSKVLRLAWIAGMAIVSLTVLVMVMTHQSPPYSPLSFAVSRRASSGSGHFYLDGLIHCLTAHEFVFVLGWLVPLGLPRLRQLPKAWVAGSICAGLTALVLGAYDNAEGNTVRPIFSACGPVFSLAAAYFLAGRSGRSKPPLPQDQLG